jgi:hypothetical protein
MKPMLMDEMKATRAKCPHIHQHTLDHREEHDVTLLAL